MDNCIVCGADISTPNYYASIRRKYCKRCAADMRRANGAARMRELRKKTREANAQRRELCKAQAEEIEALKALTIKTREENRRLKYELERN